ncbi:MAG: hypothetical protein K6F37_01465, partial [Lachnospiraceae bacterium]|nr:hypothetical protein [Lachnospiraceae bacterium]
MKPEDLYKAMNEIDPQILEASEIYVAPVDEVDDTDKKIIHIAKKTTQKSRAKVRAYVVLAACACFCAVIGFTVPHMFRMGSSMDSASMEAYEEVMEADEAAEATAESDAKSLDDGLSEDEAYSAKLVIGEKYFTVLWEDNEAVKELMAMAEDGTFELTISNYGGFEAVGALDTKLTTTDENITATVGDIMLYGGNQICIFYGENTANYTKLGIIVDADE